MLGARIPLYSFAVWHGFNLPLLMSVTALVTGAILYLLFRERLNEFFEEVPRDRAPQGAQDV